MIFTRNRVGFFSYWSSSLWLGSPQEECGALPSVSGDAYRSPITSQPRTPTTRGTTGAQSGLPDSSGPALAHRSPERQPSDRIGARPFHKPCASLPSWALDEPLLALPGGAGRHVPLLRADGAGHVRRAWFTTRHWEGSSRSVLLARLRLRLETCFQRVA
ncbi:hypothetical protein CALVIDRAFT_30526 [Calocera viscosa TUFC12733]|uniref:Uncharacterized protein n=1 Tax=Calocera viscosa (strain TUFC12733) TaxID=1330018 RepID=A0A167PD47_CALVF|nr:hypothetical protein CALVIDRAFT_30526 [Calocera viscosa TUFC12733]